MRIREASIFFVFICFTQNLFAQCGTSLNPVGAQAEQIDDVSKRIFEKSTPQIFQSVPSIEEDLLIVPGQKAGIFEIENSYSSLISRVSLSPLKIESRTQYEDLLPESYIPERKFSKVKKEKMELAFSIENPSLREIFVEDDRYATSEGIRIGSTDVDVEKLAKVTKFKKSKNQNFYQGKGITFVVKDHKVIKIVVIRLSST